MSSYLHWKAWNECDAALTSSRHLSLRRSILHFLSGNLMDCAEPPVLP